MLSPKILMTTVFAYALLFLSCGGSQGGFNLFSVQDDINLGKQFSQEIEKDTKNYPLLPEKGNEEVYRYVRGLTNKLLNSGEVAYRNEFAWQVKIIDDDETLNAFAVPGGYLYVYTGLIKYLDTEDQLAGVMGHEIAHAARRHSTQQMTKIYGLQALLSIATGRAEPGLIEQMALGLVSLKFSRKHEADADDHSVKYMCGTGLYAGGAAGFFQKIQSEGGARQPAFLSTHPDPGDRVKDIKSKVGELGCRGKERNETEYKRIQKLL